MPELSAVMPASAVESVTQIRNTVFPSISGETADNSDHLIVGKSMFIYKLVIADTGIGLPCLHDPMQDILSIPALIKRQVVLPEFLRKCRQCHRIHPLADHRQHAGTPGRKCHLLSRCQTLPKQGHPIMQLKCMFSVFHRPFLCKRQCVEDFLYALIISYLSFVCNHPLPAGNS